METIITAYQKALKKKYAIGAFNFYNLETLQSILEAGEEAKSPVICSASESALNYMGIDTAVMLFLTLTHGKKYPAFLHLDHGKSFEICKKCIDAGFDSVMIDASSLSFEENVKLTKKVVEYAHKNGVQVEAELGMLSGVEESVNVAEKNAKYTNPQEAKYFVELTHVDSLAVAIGTSHGAYKFKGEPRLRTDILSEIEAELKNFPLVLHGASSVNENVLKTINENGGNIKSAKGVSENILEEICEKHNVVKINVDTDLRLAFVGEVRKELKSKKDETNPRNFLLSAKDKMKEVIIEKITKTFGKNI